MGFQRSVQLVLYPSEILLTALNIFFTFASVDSLTEILSRLWQRVCRSMRWVIVIFYLIFQICYSWHSIRAFPLPTCFCVDQILRVMKCFASSWKAKKLRDSSNSGHDRSKAYKIELDWLKTWKWTKMLMIMKW